MWEVLFAIQTAAYNLEVDRMEREFEEKLRKDMTPEQWVDYLKRNAEKKIMELREREVKALEKLAEAQARIASKPTPECNHYHSKYL